MKSNICIFGSNSILAKNFIENYKDHFNLIGIQRETLKVKSENNAIKIIKFNLGDKYHESGYKKLFEQISRFNNAKFKTFIIFAWAGKPRQITKDICDLNKNINNNIFNNLINFSKTFKPYQIIFISSAGAIYDQNSKDYFVEEDSPNPSSAYGFQKLEMEQKLFDFCKNQKINLTTLRISSAYGYDPKVPDNGVLNNWLFNAKNNKPIKIYDSLESSINFISFNQVSEAINICINKEIFGLYNIGCKESTKLKKILEIVKVTSLKKNLKILISGDSLRDFHININLFKLRSNIIFENQIKSEANKIYEMLD
jgi:nucleoside-diphosphate-sugar epimerase